MNKKFIVFGKPDISEEEIEAVSNVLRLGWIGTGRITKQFEEEFVKSMGGGYAAAVSSCTIGLMIGLKALGLARGQNVLTTPLTFCATVNAIVQMGATPVFKDVNKDGVLEGEIPSQVLVKNSYKNIHYVLPVNYLGLPARIKSEFPVIEDAAHSFGGSCGYGDLTVFSFYANKNITSGEGGMIWTKDKELASRCRILSNHGQSNGAWSRYRSGPIENYEILYSGFKGNLPDVLSAIGLVQLKRWPEIKKKRELIWKIYEEAFGKKGAGHSKHLYTIQVKNRQRAREELYNRGIGTGIHYEALHLQPAYQYLGYQKGDFPNAEKIGEEILSLPLSSSMTEEDGLRVVEEVKKELCH